MKDFDNSEIFNYLQKAMNESFQRSMSILQTLMQIIKSIVSVIGIIVTLLSFSKLIIILCMASTLPIFYFNNKILKKWFNIFNSRFEKIRFARYLKGVCIKYENIKELKIYRAQSYLRKRIVDILESNIKEDKKIRKTFLMQSLAIHEFDTLVLFFIKVIVIFISYKKKLTIGSLITYLQSIDVLKSSIKNTLSMISKTYENSLYMESFFYVMEYKVEEEKHIEFNKNFERIEFKNVWFKYPDAEEYVIKNFTFTFWADNTYGLVGLNGSGKTTLLKLMLRLYKPDNGEILIDGINLDDINEKSMYRYVSAVFQDFIKYPFTIKENIAVANSETISEDELINAAEFSGACDFIKKLSQGFMTKLQKGWEKGTELSIGQWQKIAISRCYLKGSSIIVLDEPTASIDAVAESNMFNNFKNLKKNRLCILVTHRFSSIKLTNEILVIENGELKEYGTHENLMARGGKYQELYSLQAEAYQE
jgi:ATP-binding cassette subfamily B protein/ATP-binding cassette subfamily C protein